MNFAPERDLHGRGTCRLPYWPANAGFAGQRLDAGICRKKSPSLGIDMVQGLALRRTG
jgi:hypothetical protein